jgi:hypothetical protein
VKLLIIAALMLTLTGCEFQHTVENIAKCREAGGNYITAKSLTVNGQFTDGVCILRPTQSDKDFVMPVPATPR